MTRARKELERRLEQAKRMAAFPSDIVTNERLQKLVQELKEQLQKSAQARALRQLSLRWRLQALEPAGCFLRFHWIN